MKTADEKISTLLSACAFGLGYIIAKVGPVGLAQEWMARAILDADPHCTHASSVLTMNEAADRSPSETVK